MADKIVLQSSLDLKKRKPPKFIIVNLIREAGVTLMFAQPGEGNA